MSSLLTKEAVLARPLSAIFHEGVWEFLMSNRLAQASRADKRRLICSQNGLSPLERTQ